MHHTAKTARSAGTGITPRVRAWPRSSSPLFTGRDVGAGPVLPARSTGSRRPFGLQNGLRRAAGHPAV